MIEAKNILTEEEKAAYRQLVGEVEAADTAYSTLLAELTAKTGNERYYQKVWDSTAAPELMALYNRAVEVRKAKNGLYVELGKLVVARVGARPYPTVIATAEFWIRACKGTIMGSSGDALIDAFHGIAAGSGRVDVDEAAVRARFDAHFSERFARSPEYAVYLGVDYGPDYALSQLLEGQSMQYLPLKSSTTTSPLEFSTKIGYRAEPKVVVSLLS